MNPCVVTVSTSEILICGGNLKAEVEVKKHGTFKSDVVKKKEYSNEVILLNAKSMTYETIGEAPFGFCNTGHN